VTDRGANRVAATFALFAFNQESYIREAIEGAFAQTYQPLEIILSDDCSSDGTFAIMREMASKYHGPHQVRAVRNQRNLGILPHILARGREAKGEIVVVAAGDDISTRDRTEALVRRFNDDEDIYCVTSAFDLIDEESRLISRGEIVPIGIKGQKVVSSFLRDVAKPYTVIQGSTAAYRRNIFERVSADENFIFPEDNYFNFLIYLLGGYVVQVEQSLVKYRQHSEALSNRNNAKLCIEDLEAAFQTEAKRRMSMMDAFLRLANRDDRACDVDIARVVSERERSRFVQAWPELSVHARLASALTSLVKLRISDARWKALRLAGTFPRYQPKALLCRFHPKYAGRSRPTALGRT